MSFNVSSSHKLSVVVKLRIQICLYIVFLRTYLYAEIKILARNSF